VGVRALGETDPAPRKLFHIACTPYASRRESASLAASIIEIAVERAAEPALAALPPGAQVEVTQVAGRGFAPLLSSYTVAQALEEGRSLLIVAHGTAGMAAARAALSWAPVLAHASTQKVACFASAPSAEAAAFLTDWQGWRDAGVYFVPVYTPHAGGADLLQTLLQNVLHAAPGGLAEIVGRPENACLLVAGCDGEVASGLQRELSRRGFATERMLFADFF